MVIVTLSIPQELIDKFEDLRKEIGLSDGTFLIKKSPLVCKLIIIGLQHKEEIKMNGDSK